MIMFTIKDISTIIKNQQKVSDDIYLDAIEANYSHEQMTPLNCILGTNAILMNRFHNMHEVTIKHMNALGINPEMQ